MPRERPASRVIGAGTEEVEETLLLVEVDVEVAPGREVELETVVEETVVVVTVGGVTS
jgi:hypothetical protein